MKRNHDLVIKFSIEEKELIRRTARELNMEMSPMIRNIIISVIKLKDKLIPIMFLNNKNIKEYGGIRGLNRLSSFKGILK